MSDININDYDLIHPDCPNFKWYECWESDIANRGEFENRTDDPVLIEHCRQAVKHLFQPLRDDVGSMRPESWYRCERLEKQLCWKSFIKWQKQSPFSVEEAWKLYFQSKSHPGFQAIDVEVGSMSNNELFYHVKAEYEFDQLIREFPRKGFPYSGWVHMSWAGDKNRGEVKVIPKGRKM